MSFKVLHQILFFNRSLYAIDNGVFSIGSPIDISNPDTVEDYMNGVRIIVSNEQLILMLPINHSPIPMCNDLESKESKGFIIKNSRIQVGHILFLDKKIQWEIM